MQPIHEPNENYINIRYPMLARSRDSTILVRRGVVYSRTEHERGFQCRSGETRVDVPPPPKVRAED